MKAQKWLLALLTVILSLTCIGLVACTPDDEGEGEGTSYTVTYVDITADNAQLKTEEVAAGGTATEWTPEKEGYVFAGWYATPSMSHEYDFSKAITADTTIYGYFTEDTFEEDTRTFYILGSSSDPNSILYGTNYKLVDEEKQVLTKADKSGVNEYSITLDMYVGDAFQIALNSDFENQRGYGYMDSDAAEGYFENKGNFLENNTLKSDIQVVQAGNYTLTLTTHPWSDQYETDHEYYTEENKENYNYNVTDTLTFVRNGDPVVAPDSAPIDIRIKGSYITGWEHITTDEYTMVYDEDNDVYTYSHEIVAGDSFMFYNFVTEVGEDGEQHITLGGININTGCVDAEHSDIEYLDMTQGNITVNTSGTYSFVYDRNTNKVVVTYDEAFTGGYIPGDTWYISGSGITEPLKSSQFGNNLTDKQKFTKVDEYTYTMTVDLARGDMFQIVENNWYAGAHGFHDIVDPVKGEVEYFSLQADNIRVEYSGNYTLTLNLDKTAPIDDTITWTYNGDIVQELPIAFDVFMKSSAGGWVPGERLSTVEGVVTLSVMLSVDEKFCFIYYEPGVPDDEIGSQGNPGQLITESAKGTEGQYNDNFGKFVNDFVCNKAGYYTITIDFNSGSPVVEFVDYLEKLPEFEAVVKGHAYDGTWNNSDSVASSGGIVEMTIVLQNEGEFGFTLYGENYGEYGLYVGHQCIGTEGDANDLFEAQANGNNIICTAPGTYRVVIDMTSGTPVLNFYTAD